MAPSPEPKTHNSTLQANSLSRNSHPDSDGCRALAGHRVTDTSDGRGRAAWTPLRPPPACPGSHAAVLASSNLWSASVRSHAHTSPRSGSLKWSAIPLKVSITAANPAVGLRRVNGPAQIGQRCCSSDRCTTLHLRH
eukprot:scaffold916_cov92-Isochrysis_galbana.AAC.2